MNTTTVYRVLDPIDNLKIKVTLRKRPYNEPCTPITTEANPSVNVNVSSSTTLERKDTDKTKTKTISSVITWQTKIFSPKEIEKYKSLDNGRSDQPLLPEMRGDLTPIQLRHLENYRAKKQKQGGLVKGSVIFTYIDEDEYVEKTDPFSFTDSLAPQSLISKNYSLPHSLQQTLTHPTTSVSYNSKFQVASNSGVVVKNKTVTGMHRHFHSIPFKQMHIMAYIRKKLVIEGSPDVFEGETTESVLCTLKVNSNGMFEMKPGFSTDFSAPYINPLKFGEGEDDMIYEYVLENLSEPERKNFNFQIPDVQRPLRIGPDLGSFEPSPSDHSLSKIHIFGEIISASGFDYPHRKPDLYVEYVFDLDSHPSWKQIDSFSQDESVVIGENNNNINNNNTSPYGEVISRISHIASTSYDISDPSKSVAHFCFPFELHLEGNPENALPHLYFIVNSYDEWERHRVVGYGYMSLPVTPGRHYYDIKTWRPKGSVYSQLKSYFIGGSPELQDINYIYMPKDHTQLQTGKITTPMLKFPFATISSGELSIRMDVVTHSFPNQVLLSKGNLDIGSKRVSNAAVLSALMRAKQRIEAAKKAKKQS
eukprot:TRINITY_DN340_c1_g2_i1.p1 TRINITY_DN340_c1_g2~~TRINITY_DN340_c1_g2_i1.p1  ORF type:complete len:592 (-),score=105.24 TRINITY_DN340_c1_g2_i1:1141-2916(-)